MTLELAVPSDYPVGLHYAGVVQMAAADVEMYRLPVERRGSRETRGNRVGGRGWVLGPGLVMLSAVVLEARRR